MALVIGGKWEDTKLKNVKVYTTYGAREMTRTVSGYECQRWDVQTPHQHSETFLGKHNYCRITVEKPWCYTTSLAMRWDYCSPHESGSDKGEMTQLEILSTFYPSAEDCRYLH